MLLCEGSTCNEVGCTSKERSYISPFNTAATRRGIRRELGTLLIWESDQGKIKEEDIKVG